MRKYIVKTNKGNFESYSRNAKQHLIETGADIAEVYTRAGEWVTGARRWGDGSITNITEPK